MTLDMKPSVVNWLLVGLMSVSFIVLSKFLVNQYNNPVTAKIRPFINAV